MNRFIMVLLTVLGLGGCVQSSKSAPSEDWKTEQVTYQGTTVFIRYNHALKFIPKGSYPQLIRISAKFKTVNKSGFPNDSEAAELWKLEDLLKEFLSQKAAAVLAGTITMPNKRHFIFYSPTSDSSQAIVMSLAGSIKNYEIEHTIQPDAEWDVFKGFYER